MKYLRVFKDDQFSSNIYTDSNFILKVETLVNVLKSFLSRFGLEDHPYINTHY